MRKTEKNKQTRERRTEIKKKEMKDGRKERDIGGRHEEMEEEKSCAKKELVKEK